MGKVLPFNIWTCVICRGSNGGAVSACRHCGSSSKTVEFEIVVGPEPSPSGAADSKNEEPAPPPLDRMGSLVGVLFVLLLASTVLRALLELFS